MPAGQALVDASEAMKELGEVKDALDMEVKQNFIDPLQNLHDKDLKEIQVGGKPLAVRSEENQVGQVDPSFLLYSRCSIT